MDGDRRIIAYVGAVLLRHGSVPDDLGVHVPGLDDAMLSLLEHGTAAAEAAPAPGELAGGRQ